MIHYLWAEKIILVKNFLQFSYQFFKENFVKSFICYIKANLVIFCSSWVDVRRRFQRIPESSRRFPTRSISVAEWGNLRRNQFMKATHVLRSMASRWTWSDDYFRWNSKSTREGKFQNIQSTKLRVAWELDIEVSECDSSFWFCSDKNGNHDNFCLEKMMKLWEKSEIISLFLNFSAKKKLKKKCINR